LAISLKTNKIDEMCSMYGEARTAYNILVGKLQGKRTSERKSAGCKRVSNGLEGKVCQHMDWV
jgi:hypothetical protein